QDQAGNGNTAAASAYALTFVAPTITVSPASLPSGTQNVAYSVTLTASGGSAPYTYAVTSGALPTGLALSASGTISGTPTTNGPFNFTVTATDNSAAPGPYSGSRSYTLAISTQPVTATPVVIVPANGGLVNTSTPTYAGTAPVNATVTLYVDGAAIGTTTANSAGNWA
ncbi:Ig domain-containing protein, partial [Hymenobacter persicinus]